VLLLLLLSHLVHLHLMTPLLPLSEEAADVIAEKHELPLSFAHNITLAIASAYMVVGGLHKQGKGKGNEKGKQRQTKAGGKGTVRQFSVRRLMHILLL